MERARAETVRRHGQRGSRQQGGRRSRRYRHISNEIRITLIDHVRNHGLSFREVLYCYIFSPPRTTSVIYCKCPNVFQN